ncbi:uncharacterized protein [Cicer arietinum]|uniref:uncharacterized protein n=1 Tax=Cicer arietinum TaxID=3827 RepID=UPI003CC5590E
MDQGEDNSDEMYEGLEPDFEDMNDCLERDFDERYDDFDAMNDAMNKGGEDVMVDLTDVFSTGMMFDTRDDLLKWARNVGRENGVVVVIFRSENGTARPRTKTKLILGCEISGKYRPWKNPKPTRSTWSRKCECPFRLRGTPSNVGDGWYLHVICGVHNHELAKKLTSHAFLGRLSQEEKVVLEMTFCVGFAYLQSECVDNFTWALQMLKEQITGGEVEVIVTDRDLALMNDVECVFPKAVNLLCLFHVCKNVKAKCKMIVFPKRKQVQIMEAWEALVYSYDETQYYMNLANFEGICSSSSIFNDYVHDQWLIPHKERFVEAWTNRVMHFGNTTTQRVESAHWSLKRIL